jgi:hypothetical protein
MNRITKTVSWVSIFSTLFMGCYTSTLIDPTGDDKGKIDSEKILYVVTNDNMKYRFQEPPRIVNDSIIGIVNGKEVTLPMSDVKSVCVKEKGVSTAFIVFLGTGLVVMGVVVAIIAYGLKASR